MRRLIVTARDGARWLVAFCFVLAIRAAHGQSADTGDTPRRVDGRVVLGRRSGPEPRANLWVTLHRVGSDRAGPIDSTRTSGDGQFHFRYRLSGDSSAIYFAAASYGGIAYFTPPLRTPVVAGDAATITVFDTTSARIPITLGGRHLIIGGPQPNGRRQVGDVYDLQNDTTLTLVARDSIPVWSAHLPAAATAFQLNPNGDIAPGAVVQRGSSVNLFAPLSPGVRQVAMTYELPGTAFPLSLPVERPTGVLELLVQEPSARLDGVRLREVAPVSTDGRTFRRFLSQDVPASAVLRIELPEVIGSERTRVIIVVSALTALAMLVAFTVALRRRGPRLARTPSARPIVERPADGLVRAIATLDAQYERQAQRSDGDRAAYDARRAALKAQLADALAAERRPA